MEAGEFAGLEQRYVDALLAELDQYSLEADGAATVYIGGGSPSMLSREAIGRLVRGVNERFCGVGEFSVEVNPDHIDADYCGFLRGLGVNRISIGVQSFDAGVLGYLGRPYLPETALAAVKDARRGGFENVSIDLIFAVPGFDEEIWKSTLERAVSTGVEHISAYSLSYDGGSVLQGRLARGEVAATDEELDRRMYEYAIEYLESNDYKQYEISNFARSGFECAHNRVYWKNTGYIGIGAGGASFYNGARYHNPANIERYFKRIESGRAGSASFRGISGRELAGETAVLNLRLREGVVLAEYRAVTGEDFEEIFRDEIETHIKRGNLERTPAGYRLAKGVLAVADNILCDFC